MREEEEDEAARKHTQLFSPDTFSSPHAISCPPAMTQNDDVVPAAQGESRATGVRPVSCATCLGECSSFWTLCPSRP